MSFLQNQLHSSVAEISVSNLLHNFTFLQNKVGAQTLLLPMVKTNAYGHDIQIIQKIFSDKNIAGLGVASITEAIDLRKAGFAKTIVSFGRISHQILQAAHEYHITVVIHSVEDMQLFSTSRYKTDTHLEIETGMHRLGLSAQDILDSQIHWQSIKPFIKGIFSHFSESENPDQHFSQQQMQCFQRTIGEIEHLRPSTTIKHISNSGSILLHAQFDLDWARPGIALYGYDPTSSEHSELKPVLTWKAPIIQIKKLRKGDAVGYGRSFIADKPMTIATIPIGYGDGFLRMYHHVGLGYKGKRVPVVGNVCMDLLMIDISQTPNPQVEDAVYILGDGHHGEADANEFAKVDQTISYEVLSRIGSRVLRMQT
ncbi:MAG: alanine racemase [Bdellovibrionota bacterium]